MAKAIDLPTAIGPVIWTDIAITADPVAVPAIDGPRADATIRSADQSNALNAGRLELPERGERHGRSHSSGKRCATERNKSNKCEPEFHDFLRLEYSSQ